MARKTAKLIQPYNPLDKGQLGVSVGDALLGEPVAAISEIEAFIGAGIYAIYYTGPFLPYKRIAEKNLSGRFASPIYVGKAEPPGARKGGFGLGVDPGTALYKRLREHFSSISQVPNLDPRDFFCRFLVVEDVWIPLGESLLIERFRPLWNHVVDGFGIHTPGKGREAQQRSKWDVVHEGRKLAKSLAPNTQRIDQLLAQIKEYLKNSEI